MTEGTVAIVGAGLAGLACARVSVRRATAGHGAREEPRTGRPLATRALDAWRLITAPSIVVARDAGVRDYIDLASATGYASAWSRRSPGCPAREPWLVGVPGMSAS